MNEVWLCDADGSNSVQLTTFGKGMSGSPRWSPDGRAIAFDSNVVGNWNIYVMRDGGRDNPIRLTTNQAHDIIPKWSRMAIGSTSRLHERTARDLENSPGRHFRDAGDDDRRLVIGRVG